MKTVLSFISKKQIPELQSYKGDIIRPSIVQLIQNDYPEFNDKSYIAANELNKYRNLYLQQIIEQESGDYDKMEQEVVSAITNNKILSENIEDTIEDKFTLGMRLADRIADFGGSWTFIIAFFVFLIVWMGINIWVLASKPFDPYPFILLNLILSSLAAIQAPIIMMSQNRKEQKDRQRSEQDYKINLKAELEIKLLHEKIDHMIINQNKRLLEIQELQVDYLEDLLNKSDKKNSF